MVREWMKPEEFVNLALSILGRADEYEDDLVRIRRNWDGLDLEIERKPIPNVASELLVSNPVTMVSKGEIFRHHGEHCYLVVHMMKVDLDRNKNLD